MRLTLAFILSIIFAVGLVAFGFTFYQSATERNRLNRELELRTARVADDLLNEDESHFLHNDRFIAESYADSISKRYELTGIAVYYSIDSIFCSDSVRKLVYSSSEFISIAISADSSQGNFFSLEGKKLYQYVEPFKTPEKSGNAVVLYADAAYIDNVIGSIWFRNFIRWFVQAFSVSLVTMLIIRWGIFSPINRIVDWAKAVRTGKIGDIKPQPYLKFLDPLHKD